jgi:hypothetical protein
MYTCVLNSSPISSPPLLRVLRSTKFANNGVIYVQRGISCASIDCCGNLFTMGDPAKYYE